MLRLPSSCLVVLVGPSGSGKSTWAAEQFGRDAVVSADRLRALVGEDEHDQRAGTDAFAVLDLVLDRRLKRKLFTVVDTLGLDRDRRRGYVALARRHGVPVVAVAFDVPAAECRARNAARSRPVPAKAITAQLRRWPEVVAELADDGFDLVGAPDPVRVVHPQLVSAPAAAARQQEEPMGVEFGLQISSFTWPGGPPEIGARLAALARAAEDVGFTSLWVMDHFVQIPQVGRHWDEMLDGWTTLGFLAGHTSTATLGTLVTGVTYRNVAHLAKIAATLDVLSGGRVVCGIGAAWFEQEHKAYGFDFPPVARRFELLEDALRLLPVMWGPGAPAFEGLVVSVPEAICYPRPLQGRIPILVGGSGEKKTLRLVAAYADACNLVGDAANVVHKLEVLRAHCDVAGRDPADIRVTHLGPVSVAAGSDPDHARSATVAGTVDELVGHYRQLAEAGVQTAIVSFRDLDVATLERFAPVIASFR
ncbi:MAG TPA: TIGR03560 family F420-dependent LLM class oxidoreductase [Acidimicrobiales bacterium]|nr:TIGR03560 family F420-dependent LLM class oxidoreductase [Acidimicrobiales bacterium]